MKKRYVLGLLLVLVIAFTALVPAPLHLGATSAVAGTTVSKLTIDNKTPKVLTITLKGPKTYTIYALPGKTEKEIVAGKYTFQYEACGLKKAGKLSAIGAKSKLKIEACPTARLILINKGNSPLSFYLDGPERYNWSVPAMSTLRVNVLRGTYKWSASWCGGKESDKGSVTLKKGYYFMFWCD
jgi:hypothetical protein